MWHDTAKSTKRNTIRNRFGLSWLLLIWLIVSVSPAVFASDWEDRPKELFHLKQPATTSPGYLVVASSPDGRFLAARDRENMIFVFDVERQNKRYEVKGHDTNWIETIQFSPNGDSFLTAAGSGEELKVWRTDNGELDLKIPTTTTIANFSGNGDLIAALGSSQVEYFAWPGGLKKGAGNWQRNGEKPVAMSHDGNMIVMYRQSLNSLSPTVNQYELLNRKSKLRIALPGDTARPQRFQFSSNQDWIAGSFEDGNRLHLWSSADPINSHYVLDGHSGLITALAFSPDSRFLLSSDDQERVIVWDVLTKQLISNFETGQKTVRALTFLKSPFQIACAGSTESESSIWVADLLPVIVRLNQPQPDSLKTVWHQLGSTDVTTSLNAASTLIQFFDQLHPELKNVVMQGTFDRSAGDLDGLLAELGDRRFARRENATRLLVERLSHFESGLREAYQNEDLSVELRYRIRKILLNRPTRPRVNIEAMRRWMRLVFVCEMNGSTEARQLLTRMATGHVDPDIALAARAAVLRLK